MPDISNKGSHQFWHDYPDPSIYKTVSFMEGVETWTIDGDPKIEEAITSLGKTLDDIGSVDLQEEDKFIQITSNLKMGRALRLLQCMDIAHPGAASKILSHAENTTQDEQTHSLAQLFLQRNIIFERLRLLKRIFSPDRLEAISQIMGREKNES